jgi:hypothetical protein
LTHHNLNQIIQKIIGHTQLDVSNDERTVDTNERIERNQDDRDVKPKEVSDVED